EIVIEMGGSRSCSRFGTGLVVMFEDLCGSRSDSGHVVVFEGCFEAWLKVGLRSCGNV
ncbi:hypothetical protein Tco_0592067, partial [Tanacetum coccineum]